MDRANFSDRKYDVIVYGATGDTGSACVRLLYHFADRFNIKVGLCAAATYKARKYCTWPVAAGIANGFQMDRNQYKPTLTIYRVW